jgi:hypothetical protein
VVGRNLLAEKQLYTGKVQQEEAEREKKVLNRE